MEDNLRAKRSFIQSYHVGKITIEILNNSGAKAAAALEKSGLGQSKKTTMADQKI